MTHSDRQSFKLSKTPFKSRLSLVIIEIIALKDKQYRIRTTKTNKSLLLKSSEYLDNQYEYALRYMKNRKSKICSLGKNSK